MITFDEFLKQLPEHLNKSAFLIGNGLNRYNPHNEESTVQSWNKLLEDMALEIFHEQINPTFSEILSSGDISFTEIFDVLHLESTRDDTFDYGFIKKDLKNRIRQWKGTTIHKKWGEVLSKLKRPILTINVDTILEKSTPSIRDYIMSKQYKKNNFNPLTFIDNKGKRRWTSDFYPWHSYYSDHDIKDANDEFAIWHMHGVAEYHRSLKFGLTDYMKIVGKAKSWLYEVHGNPYNDNDNYENWVGRNSWLDVFMNNHLIIAGVGLPVSETSLRWLLIERKKLFRTHPSKSKKTWFIYSNKFNEMPIGKQFLLEQLGCLVVKSNPGTSFGTSGKLLKELAKKKYRNRITH